jgi:hypothetical protein
MLLLTWGQWHHDLFIRLYTSRPLEIIVHSSLGLVAPSGTLDFRPNNSGGQSKVLWWNEQVILA